ncbi:rfbP protein [Vibrio sp. 2-2(8)]|nr:rfbP protein [Vibrio sp. 2-2(8)]
MRYALAGKLESFVVTPKPPPWAVVIEPWGYCPQKCPC